MNRLRDIQTYLIFVASNLIEGNMNKDVELKIERLKKELADYLRLSSRIKINEKTRQKRIDIYLDDLSKLLRKLNQ